MAGVSPSKKRLMRDFRRLQNDPPQGVNAAPLENDIMNWEAVIFGPSDSPWKDGTFKLILSFTKEYPNKAPKVKFITKMFHPNIYNDGTICLDILQHNWSPIYDICAILTSIQSLLTDPNPNSPANVEAAKLYQENRREYEKRVQQVVEQTFETSDSDDDDDNDDDDDKDMDDSEDDDNDSDDDDLDVSDNDDNNNNDKETNKNEKNKDENNSNDNDSEMKDMNENNEISVDNVNNDNEIDSKENIDISTRSDKTKTNNNNENVEESNNSNNNQNGDDDENQNDQVREKDGANNDNDENGNANQST